MKYDIETLGAKAWFRNNWGGSNRDVVIDQGRQIARCFRENQQDARHLGFTRHGVRVVDENGEVVWEETWPAGEGTKPCSG
jgi:hypothetical protein